MKVPVVLPTVRVSVAADGALDVDVDGRPHPAGRALHRGDLRSVIDEVTAALESAVRVEVREADGTTYVDIATPRAPSESAEAPQAAETPGPGLNGKGFRPGEEVAIAYVFAQETADDSGTASLNLPPALLAARRKGLVLFGLTSRVIATVE